MAVYKDECVYTFDSAESPQGIDVCLSCKTATSPAGDNSFTAAHYKQTGHANYLNITKTPRQRSQPKQIRLAVDAQTDDDLYETKTTLKDLTGKLIDPAVYEDAVQEIMAAESYAKAEEIKAWELEIVACRHVEELKQVPNEAKIPWKELISKCSQCDLTANLWLCLVCGSVNCGRAHFDNTGGNGHALAHFTTTSHPLAVKLGSVTPEGTADVYCYDCDNEVRDPQIAQHLEHWGIKVADLTKTEKSMTELQLEQNAKWDFSMQSSDGAELTPVFGPGLTGLRNLGNTCYMNSVLQVLMAVPKFRSFFPPNTTDTEVKAVDAPRDLLVQLNKLQDGLYNGEYSRMDPHSDAGHQRGLSPAMLKHLLGSGHPEFSTMRQQDAFEFLTHFLSKLSEAARLKEDTDISRVLFGFQTEQRFHCQCGAVKYKTEDQENLVLPVPIVKDASDPSGYKPVSMDDLLREFTARETIEMLCGSCGSLENVTAEMRFETFPGILVVNVRRFEIVDWVPRKVDVPLRVPDSLDLSKYRVEKAGRETEIPMKDESDDSGVSDEAVESLVAMGFPRDNCVTALKATNGQGIEAAMEWLLLPPEEQQVQNPNKKSQSTHVNSGDAAMLESMGFTPVQAQVALEHNNNVETAVEWLFKHGDNLPPPSGDAGGGPLGDGSLPAKYRLRGVVSHKGGSIHTGHYVAFIRDDGGEWYLFNDEKVVKGVDLNEMQQFAYLYVFERVRCDASHT